MMEWDKKKIEELAQLCEKYGLTEMDIQDGDTRISLKKTPAAIQMKQENQMMSDLASESSARLNTEYKHITEKKAEQDELEIRKTGGKDSTNSFNNCREFNEEETFVASPIAGIFYRQSKPEKPPYVEIGQKVKKGDVLCIIEAMKMINEVIADTDGIIKEFLVENEQFVEYGTPLVLIEGE